MTNVDGVTLRQIYFRQVAEQMLWLPPFSCSSRGARCSVPSEGECRMEQVIEGRPTSQRRTFVQLVFLSRAVTWVPGNSLAQPANRYCPPSNMSTRSNDQSVAPARSALSDAMDAVLALVLALTLEQKTTIWQGLEAEARRNNYSYSTNSKLDLASDRPGVGTSPAVHQLESSAPLTLSPSPSGSQSTVRKQSCKRRRSSSGESSRTAIASVSERKVSPVTVQSTSSSE